MGGGIRERIWFGQKGIAEKVVEGNQEMGIEAMRYYPLCMKYNRSYEASLNVNEGIVPAAAPVKIMKW